ncbi:uncharacterized protein LOC120453216 [Drosophila santomea]|uniref:uncharacterized protein LOC120453216 n=1 Tax=Drosophila santomea TaxID=129105 RepID=UPI00195308D2|nr:uncharacterized protein LOC120453216 [Drosophila santomea]
MRIFDSKLNGVTVELNRCRRSVANFDWPQKMELATRGERRLMEDILERVQLQHPINMHISPMPVNSQFVRPFALQSDQMNQRYLQFPCRLFMRVHLGMLEMNLDLETETETMPEPELELEEYDSDSESGCRSLPRKHSRS